MVAIIGDEQFSFVQDRPQLRKVFLQKALICSGLVVVQADDRNIQIDWIGRTDILENIPGFNIEDYFSHVGRLCVSRKSRIVTSPIPKPKVGMGSTPKISSKLSYRPPPKRERLFSGLVSKTSNMMPV